MIKRMNKLTALLVAGTAVASITPSVTASAITKLATQEGNLEQVQAFNDGKYIYEGYKDENQDNGIYYSNGSKDSIIDDVDSFEHNIYGENKVDFIDDEVLFNLETGKADENTVIDNVDYLNTKFKSQIFKKVDRYSDYAFEIDSENPINTGKFGEVLYNYTIKDGEDVLYTGVVNSNASSYVDTSFTLNIVHYNAEGTKVTIDDVKDLDKYEITSSKVVYADAEYIYNVVVITNTEESSDSATYLQKISRTQGEKEDGAYLPKSVISYLIESDEKTTNNDRLLEILEKGNAIVGVANGSLYTVEGTTGSLEVQKYDLTKSRNEDATITDRINRVAYDEDFDFDTTKVTAFDIDVNGNVWVLYKGSIQKLVKGELETVYTTDRTMDQISVYDADDIVVWNTENEIYATVAGKEASDNTTEEDKEEPTVQAGWVKNSDGTWSYNKADGTKATGWLLDGSTWYYLNANGIMQTGWLNDNGTWYYLQSSGAMKTGWLNDNGTWYYLQANGAMKTGWLNDNGTWYYLQANGAMKTGWLKDTDGNWYYLQANGAMATNTTIDGYRLGSNGAWIR